MADTYVKKILAAIVALVDADGKPAGVKVSASRKRATGSGAGLKHIAVFPVHDEPSPSSEPRNRAFPATKRLLTVALECRCAGTDLDNEVLRAWAYGQVMKDFSLGGLALNLTEGNTEWHGDLDSNADYSEAPMEVVVEYVRPRSTLESA